MFLFYVFWEVMLVPMYFLIGIWGGERRLYAAIKFFLYTLVGSVVMLLGILALYFRSQGAARPRGHRHLRRDAVVHDGAVPARDFQFWVFLGLLPGLRDQGPDVPVPHLAARRPRARRPTAGSVILAGVLLKMGTYGFIRFSLPLLPRGHRCWAVPWMVALWPSSASSTRRWSRSCRRT